MATDLTLETTLTGNAAPLNAALASAGQSVAKFTGAVKDSGDAQAEAAKKSTEGAKEQAGAQRKRSEEEAAAAAAARAMREAEQRAMQATRAQANQLAQAYRQLPMQITDITTSLASGMPVWLVAIQQGGQLKDSFGGAAPAMRALLDVLTPARLLIGGVALAAGASALAFMAGRREAAEYSQALVLTGNAAGRTMGELADSARRVARDVGTQGGAASALVALVSAGGVAGANLDRMAEAAVRMERVVGQSVRETATAFADLARDPLNASLKLNQGVNYLTASTYEQVRALAAQGKTAEAASVAQNAYADAMIGRTKQVEQNLGLLEKGWLGLKSAASGAWDAMLNIGRADTLDEQLAKVGARIAALQANSGVGKFGAGFELNQLRQQQAELQEKQRLERRGADVQAQQAERNADELRKQSTAYESAVSATMRAASEKRLAEEQAQIDARRRLAEREFEQDLLSAQAYQRALLEIDQAGIQARIANAERLRQAELARKPRDQNEALQQSAALTARDAELVRLRAEQRRLLDDEAAGKRDIAPKSASIGPRDAINRGRGADDAAVAAGLGERVAEGRKALAELVAANKAGNIAMIRDDRERGLAQIAAEEQAVRQRLDLAAFSHDERRAVEEELAQWRLQRERQLTEQLKPEWQRQVEAWGNAARQMRDSVDSGISAALRDGEAAWVRFMQTGKLSVRSLGDSIAAEVARQSFRSFVSAAVNLVAGYFGAPGAADYSGYGTSAPPVAGLPRGGAATGTNYVERDMLTILHKGEAVIPRAYNPAAGGAGGAAPQVTIINQTGTQADATASRKSDGSIEVLLTAVKSSIADDIGSGRGSVTSAIRGRFGLRDALV